MSVVYTTLERMFRLTKVRLTSNAEGQEFYFQPRQINDLWDIRSWVPAVGQHYKVTVSAYDHTALLKAPTAGHRTTHTQVTGVQ